MRHKTYRFFLALILLCLSLCSLCLSLSQVNLKGWDERLNWWLLFGIPKCNHDSRHILVQDGKSELKKDK